MTIEVTIGICIRNCAKDVKSIVGRISNQSYPSEKIEAIFVDDGSVDNTLSLIKFYAPRLGIKYRIFHHKWKGLGYGRNLVLKKAKGDYIVWIDDGTIISQNYIEENVRFMNSHHNVGIAKGVIAPYKGSNWLATLENTASLAFNHKHGGKFTTKLPGTAGSVYKVKAARQVGGFDEGLYGATEDMDLAYRMQSRGWRIYKTKVLYQIIYNERFMDVWNKNFWYGYGAHSTLHKHKELSEILYKSTPIAGFLEGLLLSLTGYKLTHKKSVFLLPIFFSIKRTAFCIGFMMSHIKKFGH